MSIQMAAGNVIGPSDQIIDTSGGSTNVYGTWIQGYYEKPVEPGIMQVIALFPGATADSIIGGLISAAGVADALINSNQVPHKDGGVVAGYNADGELVYLYENRLTGGHFWPNPRTGTGYENIAVDIMTLASLGTLTTVRIPGTSPRVVGAPITGRFTGIQARNAGEAQFLRNAEATFGDSSTWTSITRHRGELVIQRSDIELSPQNITRMRNGQAPFVRNSNGDWEPLQIHHVNRNTGQLIEVTRSQNRYNPTTGGPLHISGPGGPIRQPGYSQTYWQERYQSFVNSGQIVE